MPTDERTCLCCGKVGDGATMLHVYVGTRRTGLSYCHNGRCVREIPGDVLHFLAAPREQPDAD